MAMGKVYKKRSTAPKIVSSPVKPLTAGGAITGGSGSITKKAAPKVSAATAKKRTTGASAITGFKPGTRTLNKKKY